MTAFGKALENKGNPVRVFDWTRAAEIIRDRKPTSAVAGLRSDMEWTSGEIWRDGKPIDRSKTYTYLASNWAAPILVLDDDEEIECWKFKSDTPGWDSDTYWPDTAKAIAAA